MIYIKCCNPKKCASQFDFGRSVLHGEKGLCGFDSAAVELLFYFNVQQP